MGICKFLGSETLYHYTQKVFVFHPSILSFLFGKSTLGDTVVPITELTGNADVRYYLVNTTGITPDVDDPNWSTTPPTEFYF